MLTCRDCGCICDPSDLQNGICEDCRTEQEEAEKNRELISQMMKSECEQITLRLEEISNG